MFSLKALIAPGAALLLAACASAPAPQYAQDNPANPAAAAAPSGSQPSALATYRSLGARSPAQPAATGAEADPHAGHQMRTQPSQQQEDPNAGHR